MAVPTVTLLSIEYREADTPLISDVYVNVHAAPIGLADLQPIPRTQIVRHLRDLANRLEAGKEFQRDSLCVLYITPDPDDPVHSDNPRVAYKDPV